MSAALQIRVIEPSDAEAVAALAFQLGYERSPSQILAWLHTHDAATQVAYVACREHEILGWIEVSIVHHLQSDPHTLIGGLVVKDGTRGLGIGRFLCEQAERWTLAQNLTTIRVAVTLHARRCASLLPPRRLQTGQAFGRLRKDTVDFLTH